MTADALCSVSLQPLLGPGVLQKPSPDAADRARVRSVGVNLLSSDQEHLAGVFASKLPEAEKLETVAHRLEHGVPIIDG